MGKKDNPAANGHAAGKSGQQLGFENERSLLGIIKMQGWIREFEAALLTGMSPYTVGVVGRRLEGKGWITRKRECGNAGFFLRLTAKGAKEVGGTSGKDISIPDCWRHHALAIQSLHFLAGVHKCSFETETSMRRRFVTGKFPDGKLVKSDEEFYFEQEFSRKSGPLLRSQVETIVHQAIQGVTCHLSYPYPPAICNGVDHETRHTNAIRHKWGSPEAKNIKLVRCYFDSELALHNVRPSRFEIIDLPAMIDTSASRKPQPGITEQAMGFRWDRCSISVAGMPQRTKATLHHNGLVKFQGTFFESVDIDELHVLEVDGVQVSWSDDEDQPFHDFIHVQQKRIEKEIEAEMEALVRRYDD